MHSGCSAANFLQKTSELVVSCKAAAKEKRPNDFHRELLFILNTGSLFGIIALKSALPCDKLLYYIIIIISEFSSSCILDCNIIILNVMLYSHFPN